MRIVQYRVGWSYVWLEPVGGPDLHGIWMGSTLVRRRPIPAFSMPSPGCLLVSRKGRSLLEDRRELVFRDTPVVLCSRQVWHRFASKSPRESGSLERGGLGASVQGGVLWRVETNHDALPFTKSELAAVAESGDVVIRSVDVDRPVRLTKQYRDGSDVVVVSDRLQKVIARRAAGMFRFGEVVTVRWPEDYDRL